MSTIFAVSSGRPPAAIAVIRLSGPDALAIAERLAGRLPPPRHAGLRALRDARGMLDRALVLVFPGPGTATGEDLVEFHCHGGRAVTEAVERALAATPGCRQAQPGEFTRRALANGRIDLTEAEGLADLLSAETETARVAALSASEGRVRRQVDVWMATVAGLSARVEASIDYDEDGDVADGADTLAAIVEEASVLGRAIGAAVTQPPVERLHDGIRVVIAGPPNAGKSTLLNLLAERDAAIVSSVPGTTRDRIEAGVTRGGMAFVLTDTAGLRGTKDPVEAAGIARAEAAMHAADLVLWLGDEPPPCPAICVQPRADEPSRGELLAGRDVKVRQDDPASIDMLWARIAEHAWAMMPREDQLPLRARHIALCREAAAALDDLPMDALLLAEHLRIARRALATITGQDATEAMLDALFGRFCLGK